MEERAMALHYYEVLSGVYNDRKSKIIRLLCFFVLFAGIIGAVYGCFRAVAYSKVDIPPEKPQQSPKPKAGNAAVQKVAELVKTVEGMRQASSTIAETIGSIRNMPFNTEAVEGASAFGAFTPFSTPTTPQPEDTPPPPVPVVKMIMTNENGKKFSLAVVDVGQEKALILRPGDKLPDGSFVLSIKSDGTLTTTTRKKK